MSKAAAYLRYNPNIKFLVTNIDACLPDGDVVMCGAGSCVKMVAFAAGREPDVVCGKPSKHMLDIALETYNLKRETTIMVGDRLNTDMNFGIAGGLYATLHVLTGINSLEDAIAASDEEKPSHYIPSFGDLHSIIK